MSPIISVYHPSLIVRHENDKHLTYLKQFQLINQNRFAKKWFFGNSPDKFLKLNTTRYTFVVVDTRANKICKIKIKIFSFSNKSKLLNLTKLLGS